MDQIKIGRLISEKRRSLNFTQRELAEKLHITDKTISKWECGNGMPEVSLMLPLCEILGISVNELLSGECFDDGEYIDHAEENIMILIKERQESKKKILLAAIAVISTILASCTIIIISGLAPLEEWVRILLIAVAIFVMICGIFVGAVLDMEAGVFECRKCGHRFVPTASAYIWGAHSLTTRHMRCPSCGKKSWCKRRLSRK